MSLKNITLFVLLIGLSLLTANAWAMGEEEDEGAAQDKGPVTEDATAQPDPPFDPPNEQHPNDTPAVPTHESGASRSPSASLAEAATETSYYFSPSW